MRASCASARAVAITFAPLIWRSHQDLSDAACRCMNQGGIASPPVSTVPVMRSGLQEYGRASSGK
jgi:hypothetical protein